MVVGIMIDRDQLYKKFGPVLVEAIVLIIKDEINILREEHGLEPRTNQQLINTIKNKLDSLSLYDWINEEA
jgi:hypothetical protein